MVAAGSRARDVAGDDRRRRRRVQVEVGIREVVEVERPAGDRVVGRRELDDAARVERPGEERGVERAVLHADRARLVHDAPLITANDPPVCVV